MINENLQLSFYCLKYLLPGFIARIHGLNVAAVFANGPSIKNSLQQMKHDINKKGSSTYSSINPSKQKLSTTIEPLPVLSDDEDDDVCEEL